MRFDLTREKPWKKLNVTNTSADLEGAKGGGIERNREMTNVRYTGANLRGICEVRNSPP